MRLLDLVPAQTRIPQDSDGEGRGSSSSGARMRTGARAGVVWMGRGMRVGYGPVAGRVIGLWERWLMSRHRCFRFWPTEDGADYVLMWRVSACSAQLDSILMFSFAVNSRFVSQFFVFPRSWPFGFVGSPFLLPLKLVFFFRMSCVIL